MPWLFCLALMLPLSGCDQNTSTPTPQRRTLEQTAEHEPSPTSGTSDTTESSQANLPRVLRNLSVTPLAPLRLSLPGYQVLPADSPLYQEWSFSPLAPHRTHYDSHHVIWAPPLPLQNPRRTLLLKNEQGELKRVSITIETDDSLKHGPPQSFGNAPVGLLFLHGKTSSNLCDGGSEAYWGDSLQYIAQARPYEALCYDGTRSAYRVAKSVSQQIIEADCGKLNQCILITHSMGGLIAEHILLHARPFQPEVDSPDRKPYFNNYQLYQQVQKKLLMVISLASAAGGSLAADIVYRPSTSITQSLVGDLAQEFEDNDATRNLVVETATTLVAPVEEDPKIPFFMVPGYSLNNQDHYLAFNQIIQFPSKSDGIVSFRSACGTSIVQALGTQAGPGFLAPLDQHFQFCLQSPKKPSHWLWFASELNHTNIARSEMPSCGTDLHRCRNWFPRPDFQNLTSILDHEGKFASQVIGEWLFGEDIKTIQVENF